MRARFAGGFSIVAALAGIVALDLLCWPFFPVLIVVAILGFLATAEFITLVRAAGEPIFASGLLLAVVAHLALILARRSDTLQARLPWLHLVGVGAIAVALLLLCLLRGVLRQDIEHGFDAAAWSATGYLFIPASFFCLLELRGLDDGRGGLLLLIFLVCVAKAGDICAYLVGRAVGSRKVIPGISPGKTWEGCGASLAGAVLLAVLLGPLAGWLPAGVGLFGAVAAGIIINLAAQFGDLAGSLLKRRAGVKDSAALLPGFGGVIDVIDSLLFAAPAFLAWLAWVVPDL